MATVIAYRPTWLNPVHATVAVTAVAYAIVAGTFLGLVPIFPELSRSTIDAISHATAVINAVTIITLLSGWYFIRTGRIRRHAASMSTSLILIGAFLALYLTRIGGGGQKEIVGAEGLVLLLYRAMLGFHVLLSILAVPLVIYVFSLAATRPVREIYHTPHRRVARVTVVTWLVSLVLGIVTYLLLNHAYGARLAA